MAITESKPAAVPDLATACENLLFTMRRALVERRQVIDLGDVQLRFEQGGETFEDGGKVMLALATGVFVKVPEFRGKERVDGCWLHYGPSDQLASIADPYLQGKSVMDLEALRVGISATAALKAMADDKRRDTPAQPPASSPAPARRPRVH